MNRREFLKMAAVGVPLMEPSAASVTPAGKEPLLTV